MLIRSMFMIQADLPLQTCHRTSYREKRFYSNLGNQLATGFNYFECSKGTGRKGR